MGNGEDVAPSMYGINPSPTDRAAEIIRREVALLTSITTKQRADIMQLYDVNNRQSNTIAHLQEKIAHRESTDCYLQLLSQLGVTCYHEAGVQIRKLQRKAAKFDSIRNAIDGAK